MSENGQFVLRDPAILTKVDPLVNPARSLIEIQCQDSSQVKDYPLGQAHLRWGRQPDDQSAFDPPDRAKGVAAGDRIKKRSQIRRIGERLLEAAGMAEN